jgi:hypothetical protein
MDKKQFTKLAKIAATLYVASFLIITGMRFPGCLITERFMALLKTFLIHIQA